MSFREKTFKDFEDIPSLDINDRSQLLSEYIRYVKYDDQQSYRVVAQNGCSSSMYLKSQYGTIFISYVSNDYLGFTQHLKVKAGAIEGIKIYHTGARGSPLIGVFFDYHKLLKEKIANLFGSSEDSSVIYTTGF